LSQADFAMPKIAANETYGSHQLRKAIDYFCHLAVAPEFHRHIEDNDSDFAATDYYRQMRWLQKKNDDLYDPAYTDMLRVAFSSHIDRGRLAGGVAFRHDHQIRRVYRQQFDPRAKSAQFRLYPLSASARR
jgi:hypothetical protein